MTQSNSLVSTAEPIRTEVSGMVVLAGDFNVRLFQFEIDA
jgi:hypothetical protein